MPCSLCGAPAVAVVDMGATALAACRGCIGNVLDVKRAMTERVIFTTVPNASLTATPRDDACARMIELDATAVSNLVGRYAPAPRNRAERRAGMRPRR